MADGGDMPALERLTQLLAKLPGLGPRSARRAALAMLKRKESLMEPLARAIAEAAASVGPCGVCGNLDARDPCGICADTRRETARICVVEEIDDLWALERSGSYRGRYHVLGGVLSAIDGRGPETLGVERLIARAKADQVTEVILALSATVDGQTTAHYLAERLHDAGVAATALAHGLPMGGAVGWLDDGTIAAALAARRSM